jgi:hypothetical protein
MAMVLHIDEAAIRTDKVVMIGRIRNVGGRPGVVGVQIFLEGGHTHSVHFPSEERADELFAQLAELMGKY